MIFPGKITAQGAALAPIAFTRARRKVGMPGFRFHDLRHTGQTLAASAGATTKDLMRRLAMLRRSRRTATFTLWTDVTSR